MSLSFEYDLRLNSVQKWDDGQAIVRDPFEIGSNAVPKAKVQIYNTGTGLASGDRHYRKKLSLSATGTETWDLTALTDSNGNSFGFASIKIVLIALRNPSSSPLKSLIMDPTAGANPWSWEDVSVAITTTALRLVDERASPITVTGSKKIIYWEAGAAADIVADVLLVGTEV